jgi:hypothetical protein
MGTMPSLFGMDHVLGFTVALVIFLLTLFLAARRWIGFWTTLVLLVFSLVAGMLADRTHSFRSYFEGAAKVEDVSLAREDFQSQVLHAVENLKLEVSNEKQNLNKVMGQVQVIFDSLEEQKKKLQSFIVETREHFKIEADANGDVNAQAKIDVEDSQKITDHHSV